MLGPSRHPGINDFEMLLETARYELIDQSRIGIGPLSRRNKHVEGHRIVMILKGDQADAEPLAIRPERTDLDRAMLRFRHVPDDMRIVNDARMGESFEKTDLVAIIRPFDFETVQIQRERRREPVPPHVHRRQIGSSPFS